MYFDEVIGVTLSRDPARLIRLKFTSKRLQYILTKPIHKSQVCPDPKNGIVTINVVPNKELESLLLYYGPDVEVLEPEELRGKVKEKVAKTYEKYFAVQTSRTGQPYLCTVEPKTGE